MHTDLQTGTVVLVSSSCPEARVAKEIGTHGVEMRWASSIKAAVDLLSHVGEKTIVVTELSLADGNWRDLVERISSWIVFPIVLLTPSSTAELWWDALECGVDDILHAPLRASCLCDLLQTYYAR